ncbi:T9SS type A sorting domain-containing protein [Flammeovirga sp. SubArs3]|uniref:T9SS type A sorting domain-containing protein n=1 Tax=Flammeovirga sp. SubArs3 TaxID=2995316 RepID=UPI00248B8869|nr:T9SS type A sorting domain-containing protein [Flammeovirga sp. SubArs3]
MKFKLILLFSILSIQVFGQISPTPSDSPSAANTYYLDDGGSFTLSDYGAGIIDAYIGITSFLPAVVPTISIPDNTDVTITGNLGIGYAKLIIPSTSSLTVTGTMFLDETAGYAANIEINGLLSVTNLTVSRATFIGGLRFSENNFWDDGENIQLNGSGTISVSGYFDADAISETNISDNLHWNIDCDQIQDLACDDLTNLNLPVDLVYFNAMLEDDVVLLEWETASEENASHFDVQRSVDKKNWETIETVDANGNSNVSIYYETIDQDVLPKAFYRLLQVDFDGAQEIFGPIELNSFDKIDAFKVTLHPNITTSNSKIMLNFNGMNSEVDVNLVMYDGTGKLVNLEKNSFSNVSSLTQLNLPKLRSGIYFLSINNGKSKVIERLIIK